MAFSRTWNTAYEAAPADTDDISKDAEVARFLKIDVRERLEIDHSWAGDANDGKHKIVRLLSQGTPAAVAGQGHFYTQDTGSGAIELFHQDEAGNETQITSRGAVVLSDSTVTTSKIATDAVTAAKIAAGAVGGSEIAAGAVGQSEVANKAIGQGELKTATDIETLSNSGPHDVTSIRLTSAGLFGMGFEMFSSNSGAGDHDIGLLVGRADDPAEWKEAIASGGGISTNSYITLHSQSVLSGSYTVKGLVEYTQASPPYDLGDGECGLFITADILADGLVVGLSIAPDPVWANNGPTDIRPEWTNKKTGKKYKRVRRPAVTLADVDAGTADIADYIAAQKEATVEEVEITNEYKNADINLIPHSWASPPQGTICLLDPVNTHDLLMLHEAGEDVADLIYKGYIQIGDPCKRCGPPGVMPVSWKWKNTR